MAGSRDGLIALRARVAQAMGALRPPDGRVLVACSGGPDSRVLLDALAAERGALALTLHVASVDHGLRPESAGEAKRVVEVALALGLPGRALTVSLERGTMAGARHARYAALLAHAREIGASAIAVGHTASDQIETLLHRLLRGAGTRGLSAMAPSRFLDGGIALIRPLLGVTRDEVDGYVAARGLDVVRDPTNENRAYLRARLRHQVLPLLRRERPDLDRAAAQLCDRLRADADALDAAADQALRALSTGSGLEVRGLLALPDALLARVVRRAARRELEAVHVDAVKRLCRDLRGSRTIDLGAGSVAERRYDRLRFGEAPTDPGDVIVEVPAPGRYSFLDARVDVCDRTFSAATAIEAGASQVSLWLRNVRPGDRLRLGDRVTKVQDILVNAKVPRATRRRLPLLVRREASGIEEVLWIPGVSRALTREECVQ